MKNNTDELIEVFRIIGRLKQIKRTGWVIRGIPNAESVADHVFRVCMMSIILADNRNELDKNRLLHMALIHDLGETATSDIRWEEGAKEIASQKAKDHIEEDIQKLILPKTGNGDYYLSLYYEFRDQTSAEAKFLKQVEKLEMALQALEYEESGINNKLLDEFFENAEKYINDRSIKEIFEKIEKSRK